MLTPQIKAQVQTVLQARMLEDKAYRAVMAITQSTPLDEADRLVEEHRRLTRVTSREELHLVQLTIKASEAVTA